MASGGDMPPMGGLTAEDLNKDKPVQRGLEIKYFVLNPWKDNAYGVASRKAMEIYASIINTENQTLAMDIHKFLAKVEETLKLLHDSKLPPEETRNCKPEE